MIDINNRAIRLLFKNDVGSRMVLKCLCGCQLNTDVWLNVFVQILAKIVICQVASIFSVFVSL